jgi:quercetin dioxygenase-like cupin family protein
MNDNDSKLELTFPDVGEAETHVITPRIFNSADFFQPSENEPIRSIVTESKDAVVVAWCIQLGQIIPRHIHPQGQDTWTILAGKGCYYLDNNEATKLIKKGDVVVAHAGEVHGAYNEELEPLIFISVVSPAHAGFEIINKDSNGQVSDSI